MQQEKENAHLEALRLELIARIQQGNTNLQTGGIGLEQLVCELMRIEGYTANVLAKNKYSGNADADIEAFRTNAFSSAKIFVQVKISAPGMTKTPGFPPAPLQQASFQLCQTKDLCLNEHGSSGCRKSGLQEKVE